MRSFLSLLIVLSLAAASCGGSTSSSTSETTTEAPATSESTTTETTTTTTTEAPTTTTEALAETDADDPVVVAYCASINDIDTRFDAADFSDPVALEASLTYQIDTIDSIEIPAAIQADIATMVDTSNTYYELLETVDFDLFAVEDDIAALFSDPAVETAGQNLDAFEDANCPIPLDDEIETAENPFGLTEADVLDLLDDPSGRAGIVEGIVGSTSMTSEQANCFLDETDSTVVAALFSIGVGDETAIDPAVAAGMLDGLTACDMSLDSFG